VANRPLRSPKVGLINGVRCVGLTPMVRNAGTEPIGSQEWVDILAIEMALQFVAHQHVSRVEAAGRRWFRGHIVACASIWVELQPLQAR
jgi:hypothetical protein